MLNKEIRIFCMIIFCFMGHGFTMGTNDLPDVLHELRAVYAEKLVAVRQPKLAIFYTVCSYIERLKTESHCLLSWESKKFFWETRLDLVEEALNLVDPVLYALGDKDVVDFESDVIFESQISDDTDPLIEVLLALQDRCENICTYLVDKVNRAPQVRCVFYGVGV